MPWKKCSEQEQRIKLALEMLSGRTSVEEICARFGVCRSVSYKWLKRYKQNGKMGAVSRQRGRPFQRSKARRHWVGRVIAARHAKRSWGATKLRWALEQKYPLEPVPSVRTIHRWLYQAKLVKARRRRLRVGRGLVPKVLCQQCNDIWTADFKGDIVTKDRHRMIPLTVRDLFSRYVFTAVPVRALSDQNVRKIFTRLFRRYGMPRAIRVDRGSPFCGSGPLSLTSLSLWWTRLGIEVQFVSRTHKIDNNSHEQMHLILKQEAATPVSATYSAQLRRIQRWRICYNQARPHDSLHQTAPQSHYQKSPRKMPALHPASYPKTYLTRRVRPHGWIKLQGSHHHIGRAFVGLVIGLFPTTSSTLLTVYFDHLCLGTIDPHKPRSSIVPLT
jgi:putative transposase